MSVAVTALLLETAFSYVSGKFADKGMERLQKESQESYENILLNYMEDATKQLCREYEGLTFTNKAVIEIRKNPPATKSIQDIKRSLSVALEKQNIQDDYAEFWMKSLFAAIAKNQELYNYLSLLAQHINAPEALNDKEQMMGHEEPEKPVGDKVQGDEEDDGKKTVRRNSKYFLLVPLILLVFCVFIIQKSNVPINIKDGDYYFGIGEYEKAFDCYVKENNSIGLDKMGTYYYRDKSKFELAFMCFEAAVKADENNSAAQDHLGWCYEKGNGTLDSPSKAFLHYKKSAELGNAHGQDNLGKCYYFGIGTATSHENAVYWYEQSAIQGNKKAQDHLGWCYEFGEGIEQNYEYAFKYYEMAAEQNYADAINNLGRCYEEGKGTAIKYSKAFECYEKAAGKSNPHGRFNLGRCYYDGIGTEPNQEKGIELIKAAANQGEKNAIRFLSEHTIT